MADEQEDQGNTGHFGEVLFSRSPFIKWSLTIVVLIFGIATPMILDPREAKSPVPAAAILAVLEFMGIALLAGFWLPRPYNRWGFRSLTAVVFLLYAVYLIDELFFQRDPASLRRSQPSWISAGMGFVVIGLPSLWYTLFGRFTDGGGVESVPADFQSPEWLESVARARATLPYFVEQVENNVDAAYIRFPAKLTDGTTQHIWSYVHSYRDGVFNVSHPPNPELIVQGRHDVPLDQVEDWQIITPSGQYKGAHYIVGLLQRRAANGTMTPKMRKQSADFIDFCETSGAQSCHVEAAREN